MKGLSEAAFAERFGTAEACRKALLELRWGQGWACPACGNGSYAEHSRRGLFQYNRCKHQVSLTPGTVFHATKMPLIEWFRAIYHLTESKGGMSSIGVADRLGTRQATALRPLAAAAPFRNRIDRLLVIAGA